MKEKKVGLGRGGKGKKDYSLGLKSKFMTLVVFRLKVYCKK